MNHREEIESLLYQCRNQRLANGRRPSWQEADENFLRLAEQRGIPKKLARQRIEGGLPKIAEHKANPDKCNGVAKPDPRLSWLIENWHKLPEPIRARIVSTARGGLS